MNAPLAEGAGRRAATLRTERLQARGPRLEILKGITLEARRGEVLSIIGPAGAGKTTFLRCCNRMIDLNPEILISGQTLLEGIPIYGKDSRTPTPLSAG